VALWNLETVLAFAKRRRKTKKNPCVEMAGRRTFRMDTGCLLGSSPVTEELREVPLNILLLFSGVYIFVVCLDEKFECD
jgi:hypothetical protein